MLMRNITTFLIDVVMLMRNIAALIKNIVMLTRNITIFLMDVVMLMRNIAIFERNIAILTRTTCTFRVTEKKVAIAHQLITTTNQLWEVMKSCWSLGLFLSYLAKSRCTRKIS